MDSESRNRGTAIDQIVSYIWLLQAVEKGVSSMRELETDWAQYDELNHLSGQHRQVYDSVTESMVDVTVFNRKSVYTMMRKLKESLGIEIYKDPGTKKYTTQLNPLDEDKPLLEKLRNLLLQSRFSLYDNTETHMAKEGKLIDSNVEEKQEEYYAALKAVADQTVFSFDYIHMGESDPITYRIKPYGIRYYNKSWYLWGKVEEEQPAREGQVLIGRYYAFLLKKSRMVKVYDSYNAESFASASDARKDFSDYYGVITSDKNGLIPPEKVILKVYTKYRKQRYYDETPIHSSQEKIATCLKNDDPNHEESYCLYRYHVAPTYDFIQKLLSDREDVEVLEPAQLRDEMRKAIAAMAKRYEK